MEISLRFCEYLLDATKAPVHILLHSLHICNKILKFNTSYICLLKKFFVIYHISM